MVFRIHTQPPCANEKFVEMYYWDTYFTNVGIIAENVEQAKNNTDNVRFLIDKPLEYNLNEWLTI